MPENERENQEFIFTFYLPVPLPLSQQQRQNSRTRSQVRQDSVNAEYYSAFYDNFNMIAQMAITSWIMNGLLDERNPDDPVPASKLAIESLQVIPCLSEKRRKKHRLCSICQENFPTQESHRDFKERQSRNEVNESEKLIFEEITRMPCRHIYHSTCIGTWLKTNSTCPTCRYEIGTDSDLHNAEIRTRMKERDERLKDVVDTDDEEEIPAESTSNSKKRKRENVPHPMRTRSRARLENIDKL